MMDNNVLKIIDENSHFHFFCAYKILKIDVIDSPSDSIADDKNNNKS